MKETLSISSCTSISNASESNERCGGLMGDTLELLMGGGSGGTLDA